MDTVVRSVVWRVPKPKEWRFYFLASMCLGGQWTLEIPPHVKTGKYRVRTRVSRNESVPDKLKMKESNVVTTFNT